MYANLFDAFCPFLDTHLFIFVLFFWNSNQKQSSTNGIQLFFVTCISSRALLLLICSYIEHFYCYFTQNKQFFTLFSDWKRVKWRLRVCFKQLTGTLEVRAQFCQVFTNFYTDFHRVFLFFVLFDLETTQKSTGFEICLLILSHNLNTVTRGQNAVKIR